MDVIIVIFSIEWWRTQHPGRCSAFGRRQHRSRHGIDRYVEPVALVLLAVVLVLIRLRQEEVQREIDSLRRYAHAV